MKYVWVMAMTFGLMTACSQSTRDMYVEACVAGAETNKDAAEVVCNCIYDGLEQKFGEEKLTQIVREPMNPSIQPSEFANEGVKAAAMCMKKYELLQGR